MWAYDEDGNPVEIKIEYRIVNPLLVDGVEVITKKEQEQLEEMQRRMAKKIDEYITDLLMGGGQPDPAPRELGAGYLGVVRDGKDIA